MRAAGVGNWDDLMRAGSWESGLAPPFALGVEAAGVVVAAGSGVAGLAAGDEVLAYVFPFRDGGAWAQRLIVPAAAAVARPEAVSWAQAAALPVPALTAQQAVAAAGAEPGRTLLVHGAGGVTGGMLIQFAALAGARVIATAGPASADRVRGLGAWRLLDYHDPSWPALAREAAGGRVDAAVNAVPGGSGDALAAVADSGRLVTIAGTAPPAERGVAVQAVFVQPGRERLARAAALLASGELTLAVAAEFALDRAADALARLTAGTAGAAVVLTP